MDAPFSFCVCTNIHEAEEEDLMGAVEKFAGSILDSKAGWCFVWTSAKLCVFQHVVLPPHRLNTMWNEAVNTVYFPLVLKSLFMLLLCVFMTCVYTDGAWCLYEKHDSLRTRRKKPSTLAKQPAMAVLDSSSPLSVYRLFFTVAESYIDPAELVAGHF